MPIYPKKQKVGNKGPNKLVNEFAEFDNEISEQTVQEDHPKKSRKRVVIEQTPDDIDYSDQEDDVPEKTNEHEMTSLLSGFGSDIKNSLNAKKKRIQSFTQASLKASSRTFDDIWQKQQMERIQHEDFSRQVMNVLSHWESDLQKTKDSMEKLENLYHQQAKLFNQQHSAQAQRLKRVVQLHDDYTKNLTTLKKNHEEHKHNVHEQLRKETSALQKKILSDTQQQDFSNVRRSLQTMLAQV